MAGLGSMTSKDADLELSLAADSGYSVDMTCRVSAYEWGDIVAICEGNSRGQKLTAGPDLYEALASVAALHEHFRKATSGNQADAYYTFIKGEDDTWKRVREALAKASPQ